jgi:hypothetical protein
VPGAQGGGETDEFEFNLLIEMISEQTPSWEWGQGFIFTVGPGGLTGNRNKFEISQLPASISYSSEKRGYDPGGEKRR